MVSFVDDFLNRTKLLLTRQYRIILVSLTLGLIVRIVLMPITSSPFDIAEGWVATIESFYSGDDLYLSGWYLYPPIWGYFLSIIGQIAQILGMTSFGDVFTVYPDKFNCLGYNFITSLGFNVLIKIPALIFDLATGYLCYKLGMRLTSNIRKASVCFALWFCSPVAVMSCAVFGMFDSIMVFFLVLSLLTFLDRRYFMTGMLIALGGLTKFFPFMLIPVMGGYVLSDRSLPLRERSKEIAEALVGIILVFVVVYLPVILNGQFLESLTFIFMRTDAASAGFSLIPDFSNIVHYLPLLIAVYVAMFLVLFFIRENREKALIWLFIMTYVPVFALPFVMYTPTYGIVLVPSVILLYCYKGRIATIAWTALLIFPIHGIVHYWGQMFYPLGAFTGLVDLYSIPQYVGSSLVWDIVAYSMCISGLTFVAILLYYAVKHNLLDGDIDA